MIREIYRLGKGFTDKTAKDRVSAYAAQTTFFILLSFIPFLMFLLTLVNQLPISGEEVISGMQNFIPPALHNFITAIINEVFRKTSTAFLSVSVLTALWSASKGFLGLVQGLNDVYGKPETRNYFIVRFISALYTVVFAFLLLMTLILLGFGNQIYLAIQTRLPVLEKAAFAVISIRTVVLFLILIIYFLLIYLVIPNRKSKVREELPGAILCAGGWLLFSYLYSYYIDHLKNFSTMYGSLTAIVLCMVWLYFCMYLMFIGAELNVFVRSEQFHAFFLRKEKKQKQKKNR